MNQNTKVSQDSDAYHKWKEGVSKTSSNLKPPSEIDGNELSLSEINRMLGDRLLLSFDNFFGVIDYKDRAKKIYYIINFSIYYSLCCMSAFFYYNYNTQDIQFPILFIMFIGIITAITLPIFLILIGFTLTGGAFIGIFIDFFSWFLGMGSRLVYRVLGFDLEMIYPNMVGKTGKVSKHNLIGRFSTYPFTAQIEDTGVYEDSLFYRNNFAVRSDDQLELGTEIEVIEHEKRTLLSLIKNHPTLKVIPIKSDNGEIAND